MRICENGITREMTEKEIREIESIASEVVEEPMSEEQKQIEMLKAQIEAQTEQMDFYESCIAEMAEIVYA